MRYLTLGFWSFLILISPKYVNAQIVPDQTLNIPSSVTANGTTQVITGGDLSADNLFHSFTQFSIGDGEIASFQHPLTITNLLIRVTGSLSSEINGTIQTSVDPNNLAQRGAANVFLINPQGILFGPNSQLDIGGSFVGTTANSIRFADGMEFSAKAPVPPLLTIATPIGLQFGDDPKNIENRAAAQPIPSDQNPDPDPVGLLIPKDKTLALIGGDVSLIDGSLSGTPGRIHLSAIGKNGSVGLNLTDNDLSFSYVDVPIFKDIIIDAPNDSRRGILIDGNTGSRIILTGKTINVSNATIGSYLPNTGVGGDIQIASETLNVFNGGRIQSLIFGAGKGGNITIGGKILNLRSGGQIASIATADSSGNSGNIDLQNISELISLSDVQVLNKLPDDNPNSATFEVPAGSLQVIPTLISTQANGTGDSGSLNVSTKRLEIFLGAQIFTSTFQSGNAGKLTIKADAVEVSGLGKTSFGQLILAVTETGSKNRFASAIVSDAQPNSSGNGANLKIETNQLILKEGAVIQAGTFGSGDAGNITVAAKQSILLEGVAPTPQDPFPSSIIAFSGGIPNKNVFSVPAATGKGGNITIDTPNLKLTNGALIALGSLNSTPQAKGAGDRLKINADVISLDRAELNAQTNAGNGGKFDITANGLLILRNGSKIITQAGGINQGGNAGNITIKSPLIIAKKTENSDINANAAKGNGGTIDITADSIVGLEVRQKLTDFSDITASSDRGVQGTITLNGPNIDPDRGAVALPIATSDPSNRIDQSCSADSSVSGQFTIGGQGGLPASPQTPSSITPISRLVTIPQSVDRSTSTQTASPVTTIREAQASQRLANGKIRFTSTSIGNATPIGLTPHCR